MIKLLKLFGWLLASLLLLGAIDQVMLRVPLEMAGLKPAQTFYVDFRTRMIGLITGTAAEEAMPAAVDSSIEQVIETNKAIKPQISQKSQRYLYVDETGALQFADSLSQVPKQFRDEAQPLAE